MMAAPPDILVLHSGGLDSTVCMDLALSEGRRPLSLGFDYGQRHRVELEYASQQCAARGVPRRVLRVEWDRPQHDIPLDRNVDAMRAAVSPAFLEGRNAVFLALGLAQAAGIGAKELWIGVNAVDFSGYPDCRPEFIDAFGVMAELAIPGGPSIRAPLLHMAKPEIARMARRLGLGQHDTWSCYRPQLSPAGVCPCRRCDACLLNDHAWEGLPTE